MNSAPRKRRDENGPRERVDRDTASEHAKPSPRNAAMDLLARREHSRLELRRKLERRFTADGLDRALEQLAEEGLQCDVRFAESFTRERLLKAYGPRRVRAELQQRGVAADVIDDALKSVPISEGVSWSGQAREALRRRFGDAGKSRIDDAEAAEGASVAKEKARRLRYLYQRGFSADDYADVVSDDEY
ncbi:MAG: regulatory protein RecX [Pseudomonadota bacterium]